MEVPQMQRRTGDAVPKPTIRRMALVYCLFVGLGGGTMALLGQPPLWPVFAGVGLVFVLGMRKRWERGQRQTAT
jgi:hypothetical protein